MHKTRLKFITEKMRQERDEVRNMYLELQDKYENSEIKFREKMYNALSPILDNLKKASEAVKENHDIEKYIYNINVLTECIEEVLNEDIDSNRLSES